MLKKYKRRKAIADASVSVLLWMHRSSCVQGCVCVPVSSDCWMGACVELWKPNVMMFGYTHQSVLLMHAPTVTPLSHRSGLPLCSPRYSALPQ